MYDNHNNKSVPAARKVKAFLPKPEMCCGWQREGARCGVLAALRDKASPLS
jgi:hypothetical protein